MCGVGSFRVRGREVSEGLLGDLRFDCAVASEFGERGGDDGGGVDFKVAAEVLAVVAAAEAIRAERDEAAAEPRREAIWQRLHVIAGGNDGACGIGERFNDKRRMVLRFAPGCRRLWRSTSRQSRRSST